MSSDDLGDLLSNQAIVAIHALIAGAERSPLTAVPTTRDLVRYAAGMLSSSESAVVEMAIAEDLTLGTSLAKTCRILDQVRNLTWLELGRTPYSADFESEVRSEWIACLNGSLLTPSRNGLDLSGLAELASSGTDKARIAVGIVTNLLGRGIAPESAQYASSLRSRRHAPLVEGSELTEHPIQFQAEITSEGSLAIEIGYESEGGAYEQSIWVAFEANRRWMGLGSSTVQPDAKSAKIAIEGFGTLMEIPTGPVPSSRFALRLHEWPSLCRYNGFVVQGGSQPFASIESEPTIVDGVLHLELLIDFDSREVQNSNSVELWFGTAAYVWQLLGRWPVNPTEDGRTALQCAIPTTLPDDCVFPGILKLSLTKFE